MQPLTTFELSRLMQTCRRLDGYRGMIACRDETDVQRLMNIVIDGHRQRPVQDVGKIVHSQRVGLITFKNGSRIGVIPADYKPGWGTWKCNCLLLTEYTTLDAATYISIHPYPAVDMSTRERHIQRYDEIVGRVIERLQRKAPSTNT